MKNTCIGVLFAFLPLLASGQTGATVTPEQAKLDKVLAAELCTDLTAEHRRQPLEQLNPTQARELLQKLMMRRLNNHKTEFTKLARASKEDPEKMGYNTGQRIVKLLATDCAVMPGFMVSLAKQAGGAVDAQTQMKELAAASEASVTPEQQQLETAAATEMCQELERENTKRPLNQYSKAESEQLLQKLAIHAIMQRSGQLEKLAQASGQTPADFGRAIGQRLVLQLARECPVSLPLFAVMSGDSRIDATKMTISAEEKPVLDLVATNMCSNLAQADAERPLAQRSATERKEALTQAMQNALQAHAEALTKLYGADVFLDNSRMTIVGQKLGMLVMGQCPRVAVTAFQ